MARPTSPHPRFTPWFLHPERRLTIHPFRAICSAYPMRSLTKPSPKTIRVCYLTPKFNPFIGGAQVSLERIVQGFKGTKVQPILLTSHVDADGSLLKGATLRTRNKVLIGAPAKVPFAPFERWFAYVIPQLIDELELQHKVDVIYLSGNSFLQQPAHIKRIFALQKPVILKITFPAEFERMKECQKLLLSSRCAPLLSIHCISREIEKRALAFGFTQEQLFRCPNPIETSSLRLKKRSDREFLAQKFTCAKDDIYLFTGRFVDDKNIPQLIEIFTELEQKKKNVTLFMIGYFAQPDLEEQIRALQNRSPKIHWLGQIPHKDIPKYVRAADYFFMASKNEGLSNSLLEAMASGVCPVVPESISSIEDLIADGKEGVLYNLHQTTKLVDRLSKLKRTESITMGKNARRHIREKCELTKVLKAHEGFYRKVIL